MVQHEDSGFDYTTGFSFIRHHDVPHYHGDTVRSLFIAAAVISSITMAFVGDLLPFNSMAEMVGIVALVVLAGLTTPRSKIISIFDAVAAGFAVLLLESAAISFYSNDTLLLFMAREAAALLLACALYFSIKTIQAMLDGRVGSMEPSHWSDSEELEHDIIDEGANS